MSDKNFWAIIDASISEDQSKQATTLAADLSQLNKDQLIAFESSYRSKLEAAYRWDLWAAAYIINGGCSDDGFDYFCDWLISRGQEVFNTALENPESLIGIATPWDTEFEEFRYVMMDVMSDKHKSEFPMPTKARPMSLAGEEWDEETVGNKYPKLAAWVENNISVTPTQSRTLTPKVSFWKRLFGKT
ncbi:MAG: DUF4240 domain-containing protein [Litorimonas sp.]